MPDNSAALSLPDGRRLPSLGLGTWRMGEQATRRASEVRSLRLAFEIGYRAFDTAEMYAEGGAEEVLGEALRPLLTGSVSRGDVFIVSKVYPHNASAASVIEACERSLRRLRLEHIDLYLLHWRGSVPLRETVAGFEQLKRRGLIGDWGVSNFDLADMHELVGVPGGDGCAVNQVWYSLSRRGIEFDLLPWMQQRRMPLMAYSPIDQGALLRHAGLKQLAEGQGASAAQLALAWALSHPGVMAIPKSSDPERLRQNWAAAALQLGPAELARLDDMFPAPRRRQSLAVG
jgi:diketogulonate reductase-like aldo/keto reductase